MNDRDQKEIEIISFFFAKFIQIFSKFEKKNKKKKKEISSKNFL